MAVISPRPRTDVLIVFLISLAATLPWIHKAYHIDDVLYLMVADQIRVTPWMPYGDPEKTFVLWDAKDGQPASLFETDFNPPLWKYTLAGAIELVGKEEWKLHLVSHAAVWLSAWSIYMISRRWTTRPLWCVAMVLFGPFFLPGQNLMIEPFLLALTSWSLYLLLRSWDANRVWPAMVSGLLLGMAMLTKYTAGLLVPIFVAGCILHGRRRSLWFVVPAGVILAAWMAHNHLVYGQQHLTSHGVVFNAWEWPVRILIVFRIIGSVSVFWPIWVGRLWRRGVPGRIALAAVALASFGIGWSDSQQAHATFQGWQLSAPTSVHWHFVTFTTLGALTVLLMAVETCWMAFESPEEWLGKPENRFLDVWILLLLAFNVTSVPFNAVRHLLLVFLPMTWKTARVIPDAARILPNMCVGISVVLAMLLAAADYEFANAYRDLARTTLREDVETHRRVWYTGNWGWVYYALEQGALPYLEVPSVWGLGRVEPGDRVYHPKAVNWRQFHPYTNRLLETRPLVISSSFPLRPIVFGAHYYGVVSHALPWAVAVLPNPDGNGSLGYEILPLDEVRRFDVLPPMRPVP